jgi:hypothetical protein
MKMKLKFPELTAEAVISSSLSLLSKINVPSNSKAVIRWPSAGEC